MEKISSSYLYLPAKELLNFFALNNEEEGLQDFFSTNGLQKLFVHFFKRYEHYLNGLKQVYHAMEVTPFRHHSKNTLNTFKISYERTQ